MKRDKIISTELLISETTFGDKHISTVINTDQKISSGVGLSEKQAANKMAEFRSFAGIGYRNDGTQTLEALEKRRLEFRGND